MSVRFFKVEKQRLGLCNYFLSVDATVKDIRALKKKDKGIF